MQMSLAASICGTRRRLMRCILPQMSHAAVGILICTSTKFLYRMTLGLGENQCVVRWIEIGKTKEDALKRIMDYDLDIWKNFYAAMGRRKVENDDYLGS